VRGKEPINWIFDWLGQGSLGENYELLPSVQPVVEVDAWEHPPNYQPFALITPQVAGLLSQDLPLPSNDKQGRIWWSLSCVRSVHAAGDSVGVTRLVQGSPAQQIIFSAAELLIPASNQWPLIGALAIYPIPAGTLTSVLGRANPVFCTKASNLRVDSFSVAAAGNFTLSGYFTDIPKNSAVPYSFLQ
jgi:hypothetical protein